MWPFLPAPGMLFLKRSAAPYLLSRLLLPGADDDGSGTVTILESYRALISSNFRPVRPVEFHWYAAEVKTLLSPSRSCSLTAASGGRTSRISGSCTSLRGPFSERVCHESG